MGTTSLTVGEAKSLQECELVIESGLHTFVEVGTALARIRSEQLYTDVADTFEAYVEKRWGMSANYARRIVNATDAVQRITKARKQGKIRTRKVPDNESQARELAKVQPEKQPEVWDSAVKSATNGKVTAKHVKEAAKKAAEPRGPLGDNKPAKPPKQGREAIDHRVWGNLTKLLSQSTRSIDDIHKAHPNKACHAKLLDLTGDMIDVIETWRKSCA